MKGEGVGEVMLARYETAQLLPTLSAFKNVVSLPPSLHVCLVFFFVVVDLWQMTMMYTSMMMAASQYSVIRVLLLYMYDLFSLIVLLRIHSSWCYDREHMMESLDTINNSTMCKYYSSCFFLFLYSLLILIILCVYSA